MMKYRCLASISFSPRIFTFSYSWGELELTETCLTASWLGGPLCSIPLHEIVSIQTTGRFPHWVKIAGEKETVFVQPSSYKGLCRALKASGFEIETVKKLS